MKFEEPQNSNYAAIVIRVNRLVKLENADRLVGLPMYGLQAITDLSTKEGDLGLFFPAETQLSFDFAFHNSMHSHSNKTSMGITTQLNKDPDARGYLGDNRRVRAIRLRGHRSDALYMPISSLSYLGVTEADFKEGDTFDKIGEHEICRKYVIPTRGSQNGPRSVPKKESRVDPRVFPEHFETRQFLRVQETLNPNAMCVVTQKLHGTSVRIGCVPVTRKLRWTERVARRFGVKVHETEYDMVYGSRKVIKDANNPDQAHYYDTDIWSVEGAKLTGLIPENYLVFGELIGWTPEGAPIQKNFTYQIPRGRADLYVYRVAVVNSQGTLADLSWDAVKEFCAQIGVPHVPELFRCQIKELTTPVFALHDTTLLDGLMDVKYRDQYHQALPLADESPCDEGVAIRIEGLTPTIVKAKSPMFLAHETAMLDAEVVDIEAEDVA